MKGMNLLYLIDNDETPPANLITEQKEIQTEYVITYFY